MVFLLDNDLYFNVENNYLDKVNELLDDPKRYFHTAACYGSKRRPLLSIAVETGNSGIVSALCSYGFSVHEFDALGMTPLHLAVSIGNAVMVKTLLLHGARVDALNSVSFSSPLHLAAEKMSKENDHQNDFLGILLQAGKNGKSSMNLNVRDLTGQTPLMRACTYGHIEKIKVLLSEGSNPHLSSNSGETAFSLLCQFPAVTEAHIRVFMSNLKEGGVRRRILNEMSGIGDRPIHMLIRNRSKQKIGAMKVLLRLGVSVDLKNWSGYTPLALGCVLKDLHAVRLLLVSGGSLQEVDAYERTPLDIAIENQNQDLLGLLARAGASLIEDNGSPAWVDLPQGTKDWINGRSKVLRPLAYWARLSLIDYNRRCLKKTLPDTLCLPETLNNYMNYLEEDEERLLHSSKAS